MANENEKEKAVLADVINGLRKALNREFSDAIAKIGTKSAGKAQAESPEGEAAPEIAEPGVKEDKEEMQAKEILKWLRDARYEDLYGAFSCENADQVIVGFLDEDIASGIREYEKRVKEEEEERKHRAEAAAEDMETLWVPACNVYFKGEFKKMRLIDRWKDKKKQAEALLRKAAAEGGSDLGDWRVELTEVCLLRDKEK